jgi:hypothetical protein
MATTDNLKYSSLLFFLFLGRNYHPVCSILSVFDSALTESKQQGYEITNKKTQILLRTCINMSDLATVRENFKRIQESLSKVFPKVDPQLLVDLLLREQQEPDNAPIYTRSFHEERSEP